MLRQKEKEGIKQIEGKYMNIRSNMILWTAMPVYKPSKRITMQVSHG